MTRFRLAPMLILALLLGCSGSEPVFENLPPQIQEIILIPETAVPGGGVRVTAVVKDTDSPDLIYSWTADFGVFSTPDDASSFWTSPDSAGAYVLRMLVDDGEDTDTDSVTVLVGAGSLKVFSEPPGALLILDGRQTTFVTPHQFDDLAIGFHQVQLLELEFNYEPDFFDVYIPHSQTDSVKFKYHQALFTPLNLGRNDFVEIGPVTYLASGLGILYTAETTGQGVGLYSSAINPATGQTSGVLLFSDVSIDEPPAVSPDGMWVLYTARSGRLESRAIINLENDGVVEAVGPPTILRDPGYGVAMSSQSRVAFSIGPSTDPNPFNLLTDTFSEGSLSGNAPLLTPIAGSRPTWSRLGSSLVYESSEFLVWGPLPIATPTVRDTLDTFPGYNQLPAWGKWGSPPYVAYVNGPNQQNGQQLRMQLATSGRSVPLFDGLFDPRGVAWSPISPVLVVSHNPTTKQILLIDNLPLP